jgi:hypothetical protein
MSLFDYLFGWMGRSSRPGCHNDDHWCDRNNDGYDDRYRDRDRDSFRDRY